MIKITFVTPDEDQVVVETAGGESLMEVAVAASVDGIDAECGGACSCATCHVKMTPDWFNKVGEAGELESSMLEFADDADEYSRLSCQIPVTEELDGLVVSVVGN